jgi:hypothetical protein
MIDEIKLILLLFLTFLTGRGMFYIIAQGKLDTALAERIALSYGLGIGSLSLAMFYLSYIGINLSLLNVLILSLPIILYLFSNNRGNLTWSNLRKLNLNLSNSEYMILFFIVCILSLVFIDALSQPLDRWDERAFWGLKAKILYQDATIYSSDFFDPDRLHPHKQYPLLIPLAESLVYFTLGHIDDRLIKVIFPISFMALLIIFYHSQRKFFPRIHSLYFTALLASLPFYIMTSSPIPDIGTGASSGYADIPLTFFYFVASIYLYIWFLNPNNISYIILSSLFLSFSIFTKSEGIFMYLIDVCVFYMYIFMNNDKLTKQTKLISSLCIWLPLLILAPWFIFQTNLPNDSEIRFSFTIFLENLGRLPTIINYITLNYINPLHWNLVFPLLILSAFLIPKKNLINQGIYLYIIAILNLISLVVLYVLSLTEPIEHHLDTSFDRMTIHIMPIVIFILSANIWGIFSKEKLFPKD